MKKDLSKSCYLDEKGCFVIEDFDSKNTFTNFFPGISGVWGIPMWVFYVNRGQCVSSFGIESKDKAIMEFQPANKAYRHTPLQGFRTFIKVKQGSKTVFYEPFQDNLLNKNFCCRKKMAINTHDLCIEEINETLGLVVRVYYTTLPEEQYAALIRQVTIENISGQDYDIDVVDGMPMIVPYGFNEWLLKNIPRTVEAWIKVGNLKHKAPYFNLRVVVSDQPYVENINEGNFYFSFLNHRAKPVLLEPIVQASCVFGEVQDFAYPKEFLSQENFSVAVDQKTRNKTPCAMSFAQSSLKKGQSVTITSLIGHVHSKGQLNRIVRKSLVSCYLEKKIQRNKEIIDEIKGRVFTNSSSQALDLYAQQNFVDNVLRGGLPISVKTQTGDVVFNVYSRKHGDPERDYNYFVLNPTFLSQGNGNYRDVNQNRRNDVWFNRSLKDGTVVNFLNLTQADGFNPLVVRGMAFSFKDKANIHSFIRPYVDDRHIEQVAKLLKGNFFPGQVFKVIFEKDVKLKVSPSHFFAKVLERCQAHELADHGEGFWVDHWMYNLDLIDSYLSVYPETLEEFLLKKKKFYFYHNSHHVLPRRRRYILTERGPRQYHSVALMTREMRAQKKDHKLRVKDGNGSVYMTTLAVKLLCLIANKAASLDPSGLGIEMEADKPSWYDSLNGLPGLLGSSFPETIELKRFCCFLLRSFDQIGIKDDQDIVCFKELATFILKLIDILRHVPDPLAYWEKTNEAKERYRGCIISGITGKEQGISVRLIKKFLALVIEKVDKALRICNKNSAIATYYTHEIKRYKKLKTTDDQGLAFIKPLEFKRHCLPLFLQGFVHALRVEDDAQKARKIYRKVRTSVLFDKKLKMYRLNADLSKESEEIGRARIFPAGWLENQSIWIHMEYKLLLELLRAGLYEEFFQDLKNCAIPFLDPEQYGRSILENSSFIVSSAHEDPCHHGRGYVARLSGSTAEFLHIWILMNAGLKPFSLDAKGELILRFQPILQGDLFTRETTTLSYFTQDHRWEEITFPENTYAFNFMGSTLVVYHNPSRVDTYAAQAKIKKVVLTYLKEKKKIEINADVIPTVHARAVRNNEVRRIDVFFG